MAKKPESITKTKDGTEKPDDRSFRGDGIEGTKDAEKEGDGIEGTQDIVKEAVRRDALVERLRALVREERKKHFICGSMVSEKKSIKAALHALGFSVDDIEKMEEEA